MFLVDSHCHLNMVARAKQQESLQTIIKRAHDVNVRYFLNVCTSIQEFPALLDIANQAPNIALSVGLHPNENKETVDQETLLRLARHPKVIAIGETGLDYHLTESADLTWQRERFQTHIEVAKITQKPLIIHMRQATNDTLRFLETEQDHVTGVMHCFTEDWAAAKRALDCGFYISFSGIVTFKNASHLQTVAQQIPLDRLLLETDAPYLAPHPMRGKTNEPAFLYHTAHAIATLRQSTIDEIAHHTTQNFFNLFKGAVRPHV